MTTRKKSDVRLFFRDKLPDSIFGIATLINGTPKLYTSNQDTEALQYVNIVNGELVIKAPPNLGDLTIVYTHQHCLPHPDNGKRYSSSFFYDLLTGLYYVGFCNFDEDDMTFDDAILMKFENNVFSGEIYSNSQQKTWYNLAGRERSNVVTQDILNEMLLDPKKGHLFDLQTQLRNVGDLFFFLSDKQRKEPREVLEYTGLNNQDNATVANCAMHGVMIAKNNGVQSQLRSGCLSIANETEDDDLYYPGLFENSGAVSCPAIAPITNPYGTVVMLVFVPFKIDGKLNTRDTKYFEAKAYVDKRARIKVYKIPSTSYVKKGNGGTPVSLVDSLSTDSPAGDWTQDPDSSLWYIDNSIDLPGQTGWRIVSIDLTLAQKIDGGSSSGAEVVPMKYPDTKQLPVNVSHGQMYAVVGAGTTAAANISLDTLYIGVTL